MDALFIVVGIALAAVPATDVFRELFQPRGRGLLSRLVARSVWRMLRGPARRSPLVASLVGPSIMLLILFSWLGCAILGWALLFTPAMESGSVAFTGHGNGGFVSALYLSLVTISTLGFGDVVPSADWFRILVPFEALFGLGVAAGTVGWLMNLQPVMSHRSALAGKVGLLDYAEKKTGLAIEQLDGSSVSIQGLTDHLGSVHSDLMHFPVSYYFFAGERLRSLPDQVEVMRAIAARAAASPYELTRFRAEMLLKQIDLTVRAVALEFLRVDPEMECGEIINLWRADHTQAR